MIQDPPPQSDLAAFYAAEFPRLAGALSLYCGDRELAAELAQDAMAQACRHWQRIRHFDSPAAWVHRVGMNLANSAHRRTLLHRKAPSSSPSSSGTGDPGTVLAVRAAVSRLPQRQKAAVVLRYFVDLPVEEVAALMKCSPGTVKALTSQGIANLRRSGALSDEEET